MKKMTTAKSEVQIIDGYTIPQFTPMHRYVLVPSIESIFMDESEGDTLLESEAEQLTAKDFITTVLAKGDGVSEKIVPGDKIQIFPKGDWYIPIDIDEESYFLISEAIIVGIYK